MDTGTIGFHNQKDVRKKIGVSRDRLIVNRIEKTKVEGNPDFRKERKEEMEANKRRQEELSYEWVFFMR